MNPPNYQVCKMSHLPKSFFPTRPVFWKIPERFMPLAFAFYMAGIMAFLMSAVIVAASTGVAND